jgi:hypothetical protein
MALLNARMDVLQRHTFSAHVQSTSEQLETRTCRMY